MHRQRKPGRRGGPEYSGNMSATRFDASRPSSSNAEDYESETNNDELCLDLLKGGGSSESESMILPEDPILAVNQLLVLESPVTHLTKGADKSDMPLLSQLVRCCDCNAGSIENPPKLASLLLKLLGSESFLEFTDQEGVNIVLEAVLPTGLFKIGDEKFLGNLLVSCVEPEFQSNLARLLQAILERFPGECILSLSKLFLSISSSPAVLATGSELELVLKRYLAMREAFKETNELPEPKRSTFGTKPTGAASRFRGAGDPDAETFAITADAFPTKAEMQNLGEAIQVRTNPIVNSQAYGSVQEYLDTQWRLMRSDAISDLRIGIQKLKAQTWTESQIPLEDSYHAYRVINNGLISSKNFDNAPSVFMFKIFPVTRGNRPVDWRTTKRLIPGSLVVLSDDKFETLIWGVVAPRSDSILKVGYCPIEVQLNSFYHLERDQSYVMLESKVLWASYQPVLKTLAKLSKNPGSFPLPDILIHQKNDDNAHVYPERMKLQTVAQDKATAHLLEAYLTWPEERLKRALEAKSAGMPNEFDQLKPFERKSWLAGAGAGADDDFDEVELIRAILSQDDFSLGKKRSPPKETILAADDTTTTRRVEESDAKEALTYPGSDLTTLDSSQWNALRMMLTQRVSLIQGPPGTGKTFIGLKAVRILLQQRGFDGPILCVCYTNHALDQFLEEILKFTSSIVRVGRRSHSEELKPYMLHVSRPKVGGPNVYQIHKYREYFNEQLLEAMRDILDMERQLSTLYKWLGFGTPISTYHSHALKIDFLELIDANLDSIRTARSASSSAYSAPLARADISQAVAETDGSGDADSSSSDEDRYEWTYPSFGGGDLEEEDILEHLYFDEPAERKYVLSIRVITKLCKGGSTRLALAQPESRRFATRESFMALPLDLRKSYILTWLVVLNKSLVTKLNSINKEHKKALAALRQVYDRSTVAFLSQKHVVGMTTTGAAKNAAVLQALRPRVVIVEEAAEIFEAHVITSLTPSLEKLILIGDHQQLRPKVAHYPLTKRGLDISLFERLIMAGMPHVTLRQQHRMHPDISRLITPIYPNLLDGVKTLLNRVEYASYGFDKRVHFVTHNWKECSGNQAEAGSKANPTEADYIYGLVRYMMAQGIPEDKVTVITMYQGQNQMLRRLFRVKPPTGFETDKYASEKLKKVRICCVDDYQGEECEIIIVSLVRSNSEGMAGFVRIANRVCVALSRARSMMFVVGSADTLLLDSKRTGSKFQRDEAPIWPSILDLMQRYGVISDHIRICCPIHKEDEKSVKQISEPKGWLQSFAPCSQPCGIQMSCGHWCKQPCHGRMPHADCQEPCVRKLKCGHACTKPCAQSCKKCPVMVGPVKLQNGNVTEEKIPCHTATPPTVYNPYWTVRERSHMYNVCLFLGEPYTDSDSE